MQRRCLLILVFLLAGAGMLRADQTVSTVQQALKDQGFYYGDVTGEKTADTTAAIRRYQIRNGLQITGEIDAETLRSLGVGPGGTRSAGQARLNEAPEERASASVAPAQSAEISPPAADYPVQRGSDETDGLGSGQTRPGMSDVFAGTPYEIAPPDLQRHVVVGVQTLLARYGYYWSGIDGEFGSGTDSAVRRFQARAGLLPDGRLNMETLAALGLLPGQREPGFRAPPRRRRGRLIYRGELVPDR